MAAKSLSFEKAIEKLEKIVLEMEKGEISLDDSLKKFEEGVKLSKLCLEKLDEAEKKITIISEGGQESEFDR